MSQTKLNVKIIAHYTNPEMIVAEAGKLCYSPSTIDELEDNLTPGNANKFVNMLASMGHESPIEHAVFTFAIEGVSRSLTHQLVRHRIASYSQQSQRYVRLNQFEYIIPKEIDQIPEAKEIFIKSMVKDQEAYDKIVSLLLEKYADKYCIEHDIHTAESLLPSDYVDGMNEFKSQYPKIYGQLEKKAIENARYVFPNACETKIIVTMNARTLLNFFSHRCCSRAQDEIRDLADAMLVECKKVAPTLFKYAGAPCTHGKCPEGSMSCGKARK